MLADGQKQEKVAGEVLADGQTQEKVAGEVLADGQTQEKVAGEVLADGLNRKKVAGRGSADGQKQEKVAGRGSADGLNRGRLRGGGVCWRLVGAVPVCPPVSPCKGSSIVSRCASCAMHKHFYAWRRLLCGWGACLLRMETSLRGRSGGHTGAAPTISRVAPCPKVAGEQFADGLKRKKVVGEQFADGLNRKRLPANSLPTD